VRAAVLGATGFVGRALVPALTQVGDVVSVSRRAKTPQPPEDPSGPADVPQARKIRGAPEGVDVAHHPIHSPGAREFS